MTYTCTVCNHTWTPRPNRLEQGRKKPLRCPLCFSRTWQGKEAK